MLSPRLRRQKKGNSIPWCYIRGEIGGDRTLPVVSAKDWILGDVWGANRGKMKRASDKKGNLQP